MKAYKLFRLLKSGEITPLFINKTQRLTCGEWLTAEDHPTKGFAHRMGWHCCLLPVAPHLSKVGRVWYEVEISDYESFKRPEHQGKEWFIAQRMKIIKPYRENL